MLRQAELERELRKKEKLDQDLKESRAQLDARAEDIKARQVPGGCVRVGIKEWIEKNENSALIAPEISRKFPEIVQVFCESRQIIGILCKYKRNFYEILNLVNLIIFLLTCDMTKFHEN